MKKKIEIYNHIKMNSIQNWFRMSLILAVFATAGIISLNAQSSNLQLANGQSQTDLNANANSQDVKVQNNAEQTSSEKENLVFGNLESKVQHLVSTSDTQEGEKLIEKVISQYGLPTSNFSSLQTAQIESVNAFLSNFKPMDAMETQLLKIYTALKAGIE